MSRNVFSLLCNRKNFKLRVSLTMSLCAAITLATLFLEHQNFLAFDVREHFRGYGNFGRKGRCCTIGSQEHVAVRERFAFGRFLGWHEDGVACTDKKLFVGNFYESLHFCSDFNSELCQDVMQELCTELMHGVPKKELQIYGVSLEFQIN